MININTAVQQIIEEINIRLDLLRVIAVLPENKNLILDSLSTITEDINVTQNKIIKFIEEKIAIPDYCMRLEI